MTWVQYTYLGLGAALIGLELWAILNDRPGDTITATVESSPLLWVPVVVLCGWALGHFTLGVWAERVGGVVLLVIAPLVWRQQRPDLRRRR